MLIHKVVIVDDHVLITKALTNIIEGFEGYTVLYEAENGKQLTEKITIQKEKPDIILLDVNMPVMNGEETAIWLKEQYPEILILALSMQSDEQNILKMCKAGANGYVIKNIHPNELKTALDSLIKTGYYFPGWVASKVVESIKNQRNINTHQLKPREVEFLAYCCTEMSYKEIATHMFCSPRTVEGYRDILFEKLQVKTRVGLVTYAIKNGIVNL